MSCSFTNARVPSQLACSSTVQRGRRDDAPTNDDEDDDDDAMAHRPFTLNDGDELSDDEQLDDNAHETISNEHIRDNFKVDNERGTRAVRRQSHAHARVLSVAEMKQIKWEMDRERTYAQRTRRYDKHMKKTGKRKPKLTRREKRRQLHQTNSTTTTTKKKKRVRFS